MIALAARQREFLDALYGEAPWAGGFEIYRGNAMATWHDALAATYPVTRRLVGEAFFAEAARRYALAEPSRSGDLNEYGASFGAFLGAYPYAGRVAYLADVARLEWACLESERAADAGALDRTALAAVPPERQGAIRFGLHPSARVLRSAHPVVSIWRANQPDRDGACVAEDAEDALVMRQSGRVEVRRIDIFDAGLLEALARGATLDEAAAGFATAELERSLAPALARYVADGVLCRFSPPA